MGLIHPCINFSRQHYAVCSIDGTKFFGRALAVMIGDVDPIWGHLLSWSSPPQPSIYSFHGFRNGEIFQEATNEIQINTNFVSRNLLKKPKHQKFLKKKSTSLSVFKNLRSFRRFSRKRLGSEVGDHSLELVHLYSTAESSPVESICCYVSTGLFEG